MARRTCVAKILEFMDLRATIVFIWVR